ncbi:ebs-bah-phd domain-containing protein [Stylonychia lemnae]|uniref:Ebs-bah-phd domain-containing protein n=1 Tax=Stylonychia lemnae TaxID=5949 RepID=A0A077ZW74_STYLE|nr:ebs-bah-phd domain-containing protein [Stylonychia lemnae]|eukprot:CDW74200.1 ebs-bah-phd domain-containing protein [Stylonychia lemnae]
MQRDIEKVLGFALPQLSENQIITMMKQTLRDEEYQNLIFRLEQLKNTKIKSKTQLPDTQTLRLKNIQQIQISALDNEPDLTIVEKLYLQRSKEDSMSRVLSDKEQQLIPTKEFEAEFSQNYKEMLSSTREPTVYRSNQRLIQITGQIQLPLQNTNSNHNSNSDTQYSPGEYSENSQNNQRLLIQIQGNQAHTGNYSLNYGMGYQEENLRENYVVNEVMSDACQESLILMNSDSQMKDISNSNDLKDSTNSTGDAIDSEVESLSEVLTISNKMVASFMATRGAIKKTKAISKKSKEISKTQSNTTKSAAIIMIGRTKRHIQHYCICQKQYDNKKMIQCEGECKRWYHPQCIDMSDREFLDYETKQKTQFFCDVCKITAISEYSNELMVEETNSKKARNAKSRKVTLKTKFSKPNHEMFQEPDTGTQQTQRVDSYGKNIIEKIYIPKTRIQFDNDDKFLLYLVSDRFKFQIMRRFNINIMVFASSLYTVHEFLIGHYILSAISSIPFTVGLFLSTVLQNQSTSSIKEIHLIQNKEDEVVEQLLVLNMNGDQETIYIKDIKKATSEVFRKHQQLSFLRGVTYPIMIQDLVMTIDLKGKITQQDVFRAIINGYKIDLTQIQNSLEDYSDNKNNNKSEDEEEDNKQ